MVLFGLYNTWLYAIDDEKTVINGQGSQAIDLRKVSGYKDTFVFDENGSKAKALEVDLGDDFVVLSGITFDEFSESYMSVMNTAVASETQILGVNVIDFRKKK